MSARFFLFVLVLLPFISDAQSKPAQRIIRDENLRGGQIYHWSKDTLYLLEGLVQLEAGGVLNIEAGTIIKGRARPLVEGQPAALLIHAGADIVAKGTFYRPIIFTAESDDLTDPLDLGKTDRGLWGGLIILGRGRLAAAQGIQRLPGIYAAQYGGTFDDDNSGSLRFVSVRHAGAPFNGLTSAGIVLAGVGEKTDLRYLEASSCQGDGIQILGSKAILNYVAVSFCSDDQFDWDQGWRGKGSFWFSIQAEDRADCTLEGKGGVSKNIEDLSMPQIDRFTFIGPGQNALGKTPVAIQIKAKSGINLEHGIVIDFPAFAIEVEDKPGNDDSMDRVKKSGIRFFANEFWKIGNRNSIGAVVKQGPVFDSNALGWFLAKLFIGNPFQDPKMFNISREQKSELSPGIDTIEYHNNGALNSGWIWDWTALFNEDYLCGSNYNQPIEPYRSVGCEYHEIENADSENKGIIFTVPADSVKPSTVIRFGCGPFRRNRIIVDPLTSTVVRRDRMVLRSNPNAEPELRDNKYCWKEIWTYPRYSFTKDELVYPLELDDLYPSDTIIGKYTIFVVDTLPPLIRLEPKKISPYPVPFEPLLFDCDTAWVSNFFETSPSANIRRYTWEARDYCGNYSQISIDQYLDRQETAWYLDRDNDGFGDPHTLVLWPNAPIAGKYVNNGQDCNDYSRLARPGLVENPDNALDDDCDGNGGADLCAQALELIPGDRYEINSNDATPTYSLPMSCSKTNLNHARRQNEVFIYHALNLNSLTVGSDLRLYLGYDYEDAWVFEPVEGTKFVKIKRSKNKEYVNFKNGDLHLVTNADSLPSAWWELEQNENKYFIQNVGIRGNFLTVLGDGRVICKPTADTLKKYAVWVFEDVQPGWPDVWAKVKVGDSGSFALSFYYSDWYFKVEAYRGDCSNLTPIYCNPEIDVKSVQLNHLIPGETIYLRIMKNYQGPIGLIFTNKVAVNDSCLHAIPIELPFCQSESDLLVASTERDAFTFSHFATDAESYLGEFSGDLWYTFNAPASGTIVTSWAELYEGTCGNLQRIAPIKILALNARENQFLYRVKPFQKLYLRQFVTNKLEVLPTCVESVYANSAVTSPHPHDECSTAYAIKYEQFNQSIPFSSIGATPSYPQTEYQGDIWFTYVVVPDVGQYPHNISAQFEKNGWQNIEFELYMGTCNNLVPIDLVDLRMLAPGERVYIRIIGQYAQGALMLVTEKNQPIVFIETQKKCLPAPSCRQSIDFQFNFYDECFQQGNPRITLNLLNPKNRQLQHKLFEGNKANISTWPNLKVTGVALSLDTFLVELKVSGACTEYDPNYYLLRPAACSGVELDTTRYISRVLQPLAKLEDVDGDGQLDPMGLRLDARELIGKTAATCGAPLRFYLFRKDDLRKYGILLPNGNLRPEWRPNPGATQLWFTCQDQGKSIPLLLLVVDRFGKFYSKEIILRVAEAGARCSNQTASILGQVEQLDQTPLPGVNLKLQSNQVLLHQSSDKNGNARFMGLPPGQSYEVTPFKPSAPSKELGLADILTLSNYLLGKSSLTDPRLRLQADVNGDGIVSLLDLVLLRTRVLGAIDSFPRMPDWRFIPLPYQLEQLQSSRLGSFAEKAIVSALTVSEAKTLRFLALRVGDLSTQDSRDFAPAGELPLFFQFSADQLSTNVVQDVHLRIAKPTSSAGLLASFRANPALIRILDARLSSPDAVDQATVHFEQDRLNVLWLQNNASTTADTLDIVMRCKSLQTALLHQAISLDANPAQSIAYDNLGAPFRLRASSNTGALLWVAQNQPNPFDQSTLINFSLSQATQVLIKVFGVDGKILMDNTQTYPAGVSSYTIDATTLPQTGVYFYQLQAGDALVTKRMILIK
jgi:hypothetical protein